VDRPGTAPHLFEPIRVGPLTLRSRFMMPPHGGGVGSLFGTPEQAARNVGYWSSRAADGVALVCGLNGFVDNSLLIPGFEPTGLGARVTGVFRLPLFRERAGLYARSIQEAGAHAGIQLIMQGATPHSPSGVLANPTNNQVPHALTRREIQWLVSEYAFSAAESRAAGLDVVELHANHEDLLQLFLSPATNHRDDEYGGDLAGRMRFLLEILAAIRGEVGRDLAVGVRLNMDELFEGGYDADGGLEIARALAATGHVDYLHCVMGNNWGAPSYIQPHHYGLAQWSSLAGRFRAATGLPTIYTGRVTTPEAASRVVADGHADVVGLARAMFADPRFVSKTRAGEPDTVRPCIGTNDCLHRSVVEGLSFGCSVNPSTGRETEPSLPAAEVVKEVVVVGAGPAGMEVAALLAERGHRVSLWERAATLGGQLVAAGHARENAAYRTFVAFQQRRLEAAGVKVELGHEATADEVRDSGADVVVVATGARPRRPALPGFDAEHVVEGRDVLAGSVPVGRRVAVVATEDHMQPLTVAGHLVDLGKDVTVFYQTPGVAPLVGKYSIGAPMAKLAEARTQLRVAERVTRIDGDVVTTRSTYAATEQRHPGFDSVVLACGGIADDALFRELEDADLEVHLPATPTPLVASPSPLGRPTSWPP
jgi:2,4-dienoyl-CoA reductase-like NADH-dependent reductase (Old Yellow Enzyme family)/thioredoxin reductase